MVLLKTELEKFRLEDHHERILGVWPIKNNTSKQSLTKPDILS